MMIAIMHYFGLATGLQINLSKSVMSAISCQGFNMEALLENFPGLPTTFSITYLGLHLTLGHLRLAHLQPFQDRVKTRLVGWQGWLLKTTGKWELIRTVLSALPTYLLIGLQMPK